MIVYEVEYTGRINLVLKDIFLLQQISKLSNMEVCWWEEYDWLHKEYKKCKPGGDRYDHEIDVHRSTDISFNKLCDLGLMARSDDRLEGSYFRQKMTAKGMQILEQVKDIDTSFYNDLIPVTPNK